MRDERNSIVHGTLTVLAVILAIAVNAASQETALYSFNGKDGGGPNSSLIFDSAGNLYGATNWGGTGTCVSASYSGCGTVFELIPNAGGGWTEKVLHNFAAGGTDGTYPYANLVVDAAGNLYGTTEYGGTGGCVGYEVVGCGTVFELMPTSGGRWKEKILHYFDNSGTDGYYPQAGLVFDPSGNLYGTTYRGGGTAEYILGAVFELSPAAGGRWTETVIHAFNDCCNTDGIDPTSGLVLDSAGNLYGTTTEGGATFFGTAFELSPAGDGNWTETILYNFPGTNGAGDYPFAGLAIDGLGNLYGTTVSGGSSMGGAVFELSPAGDGTWTETTLFGFRGDRRNKAEPLGGVILDSSGNLYGTTVYGGTHMEGTAFELAPTSGGGWTETVLYNFGLSRDGLYPTAGLVLDGSGNLYGIATGGTQGDGVVFEIAH